MKDFRVTATNPDLLNLQSRNQFEAADSGGPDFWDKVGQDWVAEGLQVIEKMVELVGIEPTASSLRTTRAAISSA